MNTMLRYPVSIPILLACTPIAALAVYIAYLILLQVVGSVVVTVFERIAVG